ncbi:MAG: hypothetical protein C4K47_04845 [Candidatus Thorarchaeota archaeon]|nr:MAG: hypothetical protein C4K47_04845 [Candidatus Thorarchaeota archaeon]
MFGGLLWKGIVFGLVVMVVLTVGTEILASIISVVVSARHGDLLPLILTFVGTLVLCLLVRRVKSHSPTRPILTMLAYGTIAYVAAVSFAYVLPWGLLASFITSVATILSFSAAAFPPSVWNYRGRSQLRSLALYTDNPSGQITPTAIATLSSALMQQARVIVLQQEDRHKVIQLMKERPLLPVSITRLADCYAVIVTSSDADEGVFRKATSTLSEYGISHVKRARPLLAEAVLMLPLIDESYGLKMRDYRIVRDSMALTQAISQWPERLTVFADKGSLVAVFPEEIVPGLKTEEIPRGLETGVVLFRNYSLIRGGDEHLSQAA